MMLRFAKCVVFTLPMACFAVAVGPEWKVVYPESGSKDVNWVLRIAAEEVRNDINEAMGFRIEAVPASAAKTAAPEVWSIVFPQVEEDARFRIGAPALPIIATGSAEMALTLR